LIVAPDSQIRPVDAATMAARIAQVRGIEVREIAGGHHLHMENAHAVAQATAAFLRTA
jgi:pimeloyl-ACP methyl ester carboxylesterase